MPPISESAGAKQELGESFIRNASIFQRHVWLEMTVETINWPVSFCVNAHMPNEGRKRDKLTEHFYRAKRPVKSNLGSRMIAFHATSSIQAS